MKIIPSVVQAYKLGFQNVVSQRFSFHYSKFDEFYRNFLSGILDNGYHLKGPYFYSLNNVPRDQIVDIEMFMPIEENYFQVEEYQFASYFEITNLLKTIVFGDFDITTEQSYAKLLTTIELNNLDIATPFYHVIPSNGSRYVSIYLGYFKQEE
ncbi:DUF5085 family protein [Xylocopilactobacillus apicola]|uniref:DUF5085 domain-containing protein n=1 Tax=Xylocopilactobacillus apicola TaxID=2932184 RepID=A0AAU9D3L4_9LACO|nr:DUF5085 family protein [Xylocopilactobacillus apicola]BDR59421.1 hypothetical protein XA3_18620 [Xylocopilactobacillus apicola]